MSNPTNNQCPNNVASFLITDYRPRKQLYENVVNNNAYRLHLQQNAEKIMAENKAKFSQHMKCCPCEKHSDEVAKKIPGYKCDGQQQEGKALNEKKEEEENQQGLMAYFR